MKRTVKIIMVLAWVAIMIGCVPNPNSNTTTKTKVKEKESTSFKVVRSHSTEDGTMLGQVSNREILVNPNYFDKPVSEASIPTYSVKTFMFKKNNVDYRVFIMGNGSEEAALVVINVTKEQLEIELLKLQLEELKPETSDYTFD